MTNLTLIEKRIEELEEEKIRLENAILSPDETPVEWPYTNTKVVRGEIIRTPYSCIENTEALLEHYNIEVQYNEMSKDVEVRIDKDLQRFHIDTELNAVMAYVRNKAAHKGLPKKGDMDEHIVFLSNINAYHPVRDWILSKPWDGVSRISEFYATVESTHTMKELLMLRWATMAIAAVFEKKGINPQGVLIFEGSQGMGKTSWLKSLVDNDEWVQDGIHLNPNDKDTVLDVVGHWIVELGEIQATFRKSDIQALKGFITKGKDKIRPAYERKPNMYVRRTVFFGTVDEKEFLTDKNGNRRFWTLDVTDVKAIHNLDMQQFWAEIYEMYLHGERWWLDREEILELDKHNQVFMSVDPIDDILEKCIQPAVDDNVFNVTEILMMCGKHNPSKAQLNTAGKWLRTHGYIADRSKKYNLNVVVPNSLKRD